MSLDVSNWVDVIVGDYNYVSDPTVMLQRYFGEGRAKHVVLIDEAHNLVDRSREMYSASLSLDDLSFEDNKAVKASRALRAARDQFQALIRSAPTGVPQPKDYHCGAFTATTVPETFVDALRSLAGTIEAFLIEQSSREAALSWLERYFVVHHFLQICDAFDETYRLIVDPGNQSVTQFCVDPSKQLAETLKGLRASVFFSATLSPLDYFAEVLGGSGHPTCSASGANPRSRPGANHVTPTSRACGH